MNDVDSVVEVCIGLGGNIEPERHLARGLESLHAFSPLKAISTFYRTPAIGRPEQPDYLNGSVLLETCYSPQQLKQEVLAVIEQAEDRQRSSDVYAARTLDLDILLYGDWVLSTKELQIPDPDIKERDFLQATLHELLPAIQDSRTAALLRRLLPQAPCHQLVEDKPFTLTMHERFCS